MKKFLFLLLFVSASVFMYAQTYLGSGRNLIRELVNKCDEAQGPLSDPAWPLLVEGVPVFPDEPWTYDNGMDPFKDALMNCPGMGILSSPEGYNGGTLWGPGGWQNYNYYLLSDINWKGRDFLQKAGAENDIVLEHQDVGNDGVLNDMRRLETFNLSGNRFRNISIIGYGMMTWLKTVDLSDNATLEALSISGCPALTLVKVNTPAATVSVANNQLLFAQLAGFSITASNYTYAPQGTITRSFPLNLVDFGDEVLVGTTFSDWSIAPLTAENGIFTFDSELEGEEVTVKLNNPLFPDLVDLEVVITLLQEEDIAGKFYEIATAADLDNVRNHMERQYILVNDIDLTNYIDQKYPDEGWLPIGDGTTKFKGVLDGNGHVISGLWINRPNTPFVGLFGAVGDYRYLNGQDQAGANPANPGPSAVGATIKDLVIIAGEVSGDYNVGALAGAMGNALVSGIYVDATVIGNNDANGYNIGGLAGSYWGNKAEIVLQDCYTTGNVFGRKDVGGVLGSVFQNDVPITINRIYSTCDVTLTLGWHESGSGGVIGKYNSDGGQFKINSSFAINDKIIGHTTGSNRGTGRFIGKFFNGGGNPFATNVYGLNTTKIRLYNFTGDDWGNAFYEMDEIVPDINTNTDLATWQKQGRSKTASELVQQATYEELDPVAWDFSETWTMANGRYPLPVLKKLPASVQPKDYPDYLKFAVSIATSAEDGGSISTHADVLAGDDVTIIITPDADFAVDQFTVNGVNKKSELINNEYLIECIKEDAVIHVNFKSTLPVSVQVATAEELDALHDMLDGVVNVTLTADIDLTDYIAQNYPEEGWLPLGTASIPFKGSFDGGGHTVSGLWINRPDMDFVGLFGAVGNFRILSADDQPSGSPAANTVSNELGATIKDLAIVAESIVGKSNVGGLAGTLGNAIVTGIYVDANIEGTFVSGSATHKGHNIGGIAGSFYGKNDATLMQDCYSTGSVKGSRNLGGIIGSTFQEDVLLNISRVYSTSIVESTVNYYLCEVGGIIGGYQSPAALAKVSSSFAVNEKIIGNNRSTARFTGRFIADIGDAVFGDNLFAAETLQLSENLGSSFITITPDLEDSKDWQRQGVNISIKELILQNTYEDLDWDFSETWTMGNGEYPLPILKKISSTIQPLIYPAHLEIKYTVSLEVDDSDGENGIISLHSAFPYWERTVEEGEDVPVYIRPDAGYMLESLLVNGVERITEVVDNVYTITAISENTVVIAKFGIMTNIKTADAMTDIRVFVNNNRQIEIVQTSTIQAATVTVFNALGRKVAEQPVAGSITIINQRFESGIYIVKTGNQIVKVIVK